MRLLLGCGDIASHLALEEYLLDFGPADTPFTLLYESWPAVVIGSGQVTHAEANDHARALGLPVVRRRSGGGAVYHGPGCLCFCRILPCADPKALSLDACLAPVLAALHDLGIPAETSARHDLLLGGRKLGGTAAHLSQDRVLFHGTLLFDADLSLLSSVLGPESRFVSGKGVASVKSHVTNLRAFSSRFSTMADFAEALLARLAPGEETLCLAETAKAEIARLAKAEYSAWDWNEGRNPDCVMALPLSDGSIARLFLHRERVVRCEHASASLGAALTGLLYAPETLAAAAAPHIPAAQCCIFPEAR